MVPHSQARIEASSSCKPICLEEWGKTDSHQRHAIRSRRPEFVCYLPKSNQSIMVDPEAKGSLSFTVAMGLHLIKDQSK